MDAGASVRLEVQQLIDDRSPENRVVMCSNGSVILAQFAARLREFLFRENWSYIRCVETWFVH